jgi:putative peptidoglycan lipid II flippase
VAVASTLFWLTLLILGGVTAVFILLAPLLMRPFGDPGGDYDLAVGLSRVLFPIVVLLGLSGIVVGILNTYHHFALPALAPVAWNLVIIVGLVLGVPRIEDESGSSTCTRASSFSGRSSSSFFPIPWLASSTVALGRHRLARPGCQARARADAPVTLTIGLVNVNFLVDTLFASRLLDPELAPAAIDKAFRLYMLPQGIFAGSRHDGALPDARATRGADDMAACGARSTAGSARSRSCSSRGARLDRAREADRRARLPARRVHAEDTVIVAQCLQAFSIGLVFNGWLLILNRSFYAVQTNWVPTAIALGPSR